jgi:hypothetical protein
VGGAGTVSLDSVVSLGGSAPVGTLVSADGGWLAGGGGPADCASADQHDKEVAARAATMTMRCTPDIHVPASSA